MGADGSPRAGDRRTGFPWPESLATAVAFLTILPLPRGAVGRGNLGAATASFPLIGAALGAAVGLVGLGLDRWFPPPAVAALLVALGAVLTGGLHLDGLMDTADGVFGGRDREARLAIMRDSQVGAFGVVAGGVALLLPFAMLSALTGMPRLLALALAWGLGRWAMVLAIHAFPAARADGLGASITAARRRVPLMIAAITTVAGVGLLGTSGIVALLLASAVSLAGGRLLSSRLGGLTGDTYGALAVAAETAVLAFAVALRTPVGAS